MVPVDNTLEQHQKGECVMLNKLFYSIGYVFFFIWGLLAIVWDVLRDIWDYGSMSLISFITFFSRRMYKKGGDEITTKDKLVMFWLATMISSAERKEEILPETIINAKRKLLHIPKAGVLFWAEGVLLVERWL